MMEHDLLTNALRIFTFHGNTLVLFRKKWMIFSHSLGSRLAPTLIFCFEYKSFITTSFSTSLCSKSIFSLDSIVSISICTRTLVHFLEGPGASSYVRFSATCHSLRSYAIAIAIGEERQWISSRRIGFPWVYGSVIMSVGAMWLGPIFIELLYVIYSSGEVRTSFCLSFLVLTICRRIAFGLLLIILVPVPCDI